MSAAWAVEDTEHPPLSFFPVRGVAWAGVDAEDAMGAGEDVCDGDGVAHVEGVRADGGARADEDANVGYRSDRGSNGLMWMLYCLVVRR